MLDGVYAAGPSGAPRFHPLPPLCMSPKQLRGARVDSRSDAFTFGVVLYEMLTGQRPFAEESPDGEGLVERIEASRRSPVRKLAPKTPRALARLVERCLRAKPKHRFAATAELRRALERQLGQPSAADCREEIAAWLWERKVFKAAKGETKRTPRARPKALSWARRAVMPVLAAGLAAAVALGWVERARHAPCAARLRSEPTRRAVTESQAKSGKHGA